MRIACTLILQAWQEDETTAAPERGARTRGVDRLVFLGAMDQHTHVAVLQRRDLLIYCEKRRAALSVSLQKFNNHLTTFFRLFIKQMMGCFRQNNSMVVREQSSEFLVNELQKLKCLGAR